MLVGFPFFSDAGTTYKNTPTIEQENTTTTDSLKQYFEEAYRLYPNLPSGILEAISYTTTRLTHLRPDESRANCSGTPPLYGVMGLVLDGKDMFASTMQQLATVSGFSIEELKNSPRKNIIGTAAWLNSQREGSGLSGIKNAVKNFTGIPDNNTSLTNFVREDFALEVFKMVKKGIILNDIKYTSARNTININDYFTSEFLNIFNTNTLLLSVEEILPEGRISNTPDYPGATWVGSNCYNSREGTPITDVVIHDMEGYFDYTVYSHFQNCNNEVSSHYCIRSNDGFVVQLVPEAERAWHIGIGNSYSIGIEHEGFANNAAWYTEEMYRASAYLVRDITQSGYGIEPTNCYVGPSNLPGQIDPLPASIAIKGHCHYPPTINTNYHWDPGPNWDWYYYYDLVNASILDVPALSLKEAITLYPNPTQGKLNYKLAGYRLQDIKVYGIDGRYIQNAEPNNNSIDLSAVAQGSYLLQFIDTEDNTAVFTVVKY